MEPVSQPAAAPYPVQFSVAPIRTGSSAASRTFFRLILAIPILLVAGAIGGSGSGAGGMLFIGTLLLLLFRQKYPRWWYDGKQELMRFSNRSVLPRPPGRPLSVHRR